MGLGFAFALVVGDVSAAPQVDFLDASVAGVPGVQIDLEWTTDIENEIATFDIWRSSTSMGGIELVYSAPSQGGGTYGFSDGATSTGIDYEYGIVAMTGSSETIQAMGPIPTDGTPSIPTEECGLSGIVSCSPALYDTTCGRLDARINLGNSGAWMCSSTFEAYLDDMATWPEARANSTLVKPLVTIDGQGVITESSDILELAQGTRLLPDATSHVELREKIPLAKYHQMAPPVREGIATDANGSAVASCAEYGFQTIESVGNWKDYVEHTTMTQLEQVGQIFEGPHAFVDVSGSPGSFMGTNVAEDSDGTPIPDVLAHSLAPGYAHTLFADLVVTSVFNAWDRANSRPTANGSISYIPETWGYHYEGYYRAVSNGWSADELNELHDLVGDLLQAMARYSKLELEKLRTVMEDEVRSQSIGPDDVWHSVNARMENGPFVNGNPLACQWELFERLANLVEEMGQQTGLYNGYILDGLENPSPLFDPVTMGTVFGLEPQEMGSFLDPFHELEGHPGSPPERPAGFAGGFVNPPPGMECEEEIDPVLEPLVTASNLPPHDEFFAWRVSQLDGAQAIVAAQIDELYDRVLVHCDPVEKCAWAPKMLLEKLDQHYEAYRSRMEDECDKVTGDDFDNLERLFQVAPETLFDSQAAQEIQDMQAVDYTANVTNMHQLWDSVAQYRALIYTAQVQALRKLGRDMYRWLPKDSNNRATTMARDGFERTRASDGFFLSATQQTQTGFDDCFPEAGTPEFFQRLEEFNQNPNLVLNAICDCSICVGSA